MGGFHDILSKVISSIRRFVDHDIWSMRRLGDYDVWLTTTYRLKFVEFRRGCAKTSHLANQQLICALVNVVQIISKPDRQNRLSHPYNFCESYF